MNLFKNVHESWIPFLHSLAYKEPLVNFLESLDSMSFQPKKEQIFRVFEMPLKDIKVVLLGTNPYPNPGDAIGYSYGVNKDSKIPKLLQSVKSEIFMSSAVIQGNFYEPEYNTFEHLRQQGVFLMNLSLTVATGEPGSHFNYWEEFTDSVISYISSENPCVWILWGERLTQKRQNIKNTFLVKGYDEQTIKEIPIYPEANYVLTGNHPLKFDENEPLFFEKGFYFVNEILKKRSLKEIIW